MADDTKDRTLHAGQGESDSHHTRGRRHHRAGLIANKDGEMKALLLSRYRNLEMTEVPVPEPGRNEVLIRVAACGICGSDVHGYDGSSGRRIPPIVMGHEAAGRIAAVGEDVTGVDESDTA